MFTPVDLACFRARISGWWTQVQGFWVGLPGIMQSPCLARFVAALSPILSTPWKWSTFEYVWYVWYGFDMFWLRVTPCLEVFIALQSKLLCLRRIHHVVDISIRLSMLFARIWRCLCGPLGLLTLIGDLSQRLFFAPLRQRLASLESNFEGLLCGQKTTLKMPKLQHGSACIIALIEPYSPYSPPIVWHNMTMFDMVWQSLTCSSKFWISSGFWASASSFSSSWETTRAAVRWQKKNTKKNWATSDNRDNQVPSWQNHSATVGWSMVFVSIWLYCFFNITLAAKPRPIEISSPTMFPTTINSKMSNLNRASLSRSLRRRNFCIAHWHRSTVRRLSALRSLLRRLLRRCLHWRGPGPRGRRGRRGRRGIWCEQFRFFRPCLEHRDPGMLLALQDVSCCACQKWNDTLCVTSNAHYALCPTIVQS